MKRLLLLRHAKSDWGDDSLDDHDRPLNDRGERAATLIGAFLAQRVLLPDVVLCSTALRARQTWDRVAAELPGPPEVELDSSLYLAAASTLAKSVARVSDARDNVLVIAHNPGTEQFAAWLDPDAAERPRFPTAALGLFQLRVDRWADLARGAAELEELVLPKRLV